MLGRLVASRAFAGLLAAALALGILLTPWWRHVELKILDALVVRTAPNEARLPVTIVGIDEATFAALKSGWPLPRRYHARLLERLGEAGAAVVGFDIAFPQLAGREDDDELAVAIGRFRRVVLASDLGFREDARVRQWSRVDPAPLFLAAGARQGFASLELDDDGVLRRVPTVYDAFWRAVLADFLEAHPEIDSPPEPTPDMRIRYVGGPHTFTYIPYYQLLEPDKYLPGKWREFLKDNIVLVGRNVNVIQDVGAAEAEMYQTPFFARGGEFMPRVEAHANVIHNMLTQEVLREAPAAWALAAAAGAALLAFLLMRRFHLLWSAAVLALLLALLAAAEYGALARGNLLLPLAGAALSAILVFASQGASGFLAEQAQRRAVKSAFGMYVTPALVEQMVAHPERLRLGGERRTLTIMFTDLAGFTSISEKLDPEQVSEVLNRYLSEMVAILLRHSGTVDKFLGDGIMAFWGAPLADAQGAERALRAAIDMQARMDGLAREIAEETGIELYMRIGLNRGECIVGNFGGNNRFDYSAIGDPANLASRLEGANKAYGTRILVSESVADAAGGAIALREVDTIRVKGKKVGVTVFTPNDDRDLNTASDAALAAWRAGRFEQAGEQWRAILARWPGDPVTKVFLARLERLRERGRPDEWDGIATLDEK